MEHFVCAVQKYAVYKDEINRTYDVTDGTTILANTHSKQSALKFIDNLLLTSRYYDEDEFYQCCELSYN